MKTSRSLRRWHEPSNARVSLEELLAAAEFVTGVSADALTGGRGDSRTSRARHALCLASARCGWSLTDTGRALGGRNHTTVLRGLRTAERDALLNKVAERIQQAAGSTGAVDTRRPITPEQELTDESVWRREYPHLVARGVTAAKWREALGRP